MAHCDKCRGKFSRKHIWGARPEDIEIDPRNAREVFIAFTDGAPMVRRGAMAIPIRASFRCPRLHRQLTAHSNRAVSIRFPRTAPTVREPRSNEASSNRAAKPDRMEVRDLPRSTIWCSTRERLVRYRPPACTMGLAKAFLTCHDDRSRDNRGRQHACRRFRRELVFCHPDFRKRSRRDRPLRVRSGALRDDRPDVRWQHFDRFRAASVRGRVVRAFNAQPSDRNVELGWHAVHAKPNRAARQQLAEQHRRVVAGPPKPSVIEFAEGPGSASWKENRNDIVVKHAAVPFQNRRI